MHKYTSKEKIPVIKSDAEIYYTLISEIRKIILIPYIIRFWFMRKII